MGAAKMLTLTSGFKKEIDIKRYAKVEKITGGMLKDSTVLRGVRFNKDKTHPKITRRIENANIVQYHKNYRFEGRELIRRMVIQGGTHFGGSKMWAIMGEGARNKDHRGRELPRTFSYRGLQERGSEEQGQPG